MLDKIQTIHILLLLFVVVTVFEYFKIPPDQAILATIFLALNVNNSNTLKPS